MYPPRALSSLPPVHEKASGFPEAFFIEVKILLPVFFQVIAEKVIDEKPHGFRAFLGVPFQGMRQEQGRRKGRHDEHSQRLQEHSHRHHGNGSGRKCCYL